MQVPFPTSPRSWLDLIIYLLAIVFAGGWFREWRERKKIPAEIHYTDAKTVRERAEALKIEAEATKTYNDIIRDIRKDLREAEQAWEQEKKQLVEDRDLWKDRFEMIELELERFRHGGNGLAH
ncbi:MAG TPA: hypothetical protein VN256_13080 [Pyrinomonadaceae bacterium]|nr:hypothetical protein [Pyrinomonadaceae bacterium]